MNPTVAVYLHHGIQAATGWADLSTDAIYAAAHAAGVQPVPTRLGVARRREDPARQLPRPDCPCPMCEAADHSPVATVERERALRSIMREHQQPQLRRAIDPDPTWRNYALCRGRDTAVWFSDHPDDRKTAHDLCWSCPARQACLDYAMANHIDFGTWGGYTQRGRRRLRKERRAA